ncbi:hypothetical protein H4R34_003067 [Dimargaris verticillata]|uniref:Uncharacterized protein n=1 Tax=Dimargaris verticillata TaxID=2761393 RepID=A0A9W8B1D6_9FUNG|nr:hypothetical protein H4R34_003067 [Dimargaris verticillata]
MARPSSLFEFANRGCDRDCACGYCKKGNRPDTLDRMVHIELSTPISTSGITPEHGCPLPSIQLAPPLPPA